MSHRLVVWRLDDRDEVVPPGKRVCGDHFASELGDPIGQGRQAIGVGMDCVSALRRQRRQHGVCRHFASSPRQDAGPGTAATLRRLGDDDNGSPAQLPGANAPRRALFRHGMDRVSNTNPGDGQDGAPIADASRW
jgi:hypothetical protein